MTYKLILEGDSKSVGVIDERVVATDDELAQTIGHFAIWYFLALESIDWRDAYHTMSPANCPVDALLAFTCDKATDKPDGPHRYGLPKGKLAYGYAWVNQSKKAIGLYVERQR